jgi:hypothetical protein
MTKTKTAYYTRKTTSQQMTTVKFIVHTPDEFRDALPESGVFDFTDCKLKVQANEFTEVSELHQITKILGAAIHVTDIEIKTRPYDLSFDYDQNGIHIEVISVPMYTSGVKKSGLRPRTPNKKRIKDEE